MPEYVRAFDIGFAYVPDKPQYRDQPPSKTVEFLAANLPVLATNTPGNQEFIDSGENGHLVSHDIDAYANGLTTLLSNPAYRDTISSGARESVDEYDYKSIVENELLPLYRRLLHEQ